MWTKVVSVASSAENCRPSPRPRLRRIRTEITNQAITPIPMCTAKKSEPVPVKAITARATGSAPRAEKAGPS